MTDKDTHTPLPCPICGDEPRVLYEGGIWSVSCTSGNPSHLVWLYGVTEAEAMTAWNTRAVNSHHDLIEALEALLNSSGARGVYHASKHFDAVEAAEDLLATIKEAGRG